MSFANQPSRLLISSDDLDYGQGNSFTCTLPEPITGAVRADLIRAVIPNTGYPIPAYQANFYYYASAAPTTLVTVSLNTNQYFDSIAGGTYPFLTALNAMAPGVLTFSYNANTTRITVTAASGTIKVAPSTAWATPFALNTRIGFQNAGSSAFSASQTGTILPNLIRSKVVYVLCNVVMNDTISTDGLRTAISKVPINSSYGGLTIYVPPVLNWNRLVAGQSYQQVKIDLLDDQYQPYPLSTEEFCEFEIAFRYDDIEDARMLR